MRSFPVEIIVVPTLGPFEEDEPYLTDRTIQGTLNTRNSHRHFRNIWYREDRDRFDGFARLLKETWPDIEIEPPELQISGRDRTLTMMFHERRIPRELYWSGFGLQIWLQMLTHAMRGGINSILVLDEPDIYLHSDLQRKLLRFIKSRYHQYFLATHSTEIINEADAGDVISIVRGQRNARRVATEENYRALFSYLGSSENAEFSRMARAKRIMFFEGKDRKIIRWLSEKAGGFPLIEDPDTLFLQSGGFGQWSKVKSVHWTLDTVFHVDVKVASLFDRDFRCDEELEEFIDDMASENIRCHILGCKEIENYALNYDCLVRILIKRSKEANKDISHDESKEILNDIFEKLEKNFRSQRSSF